MEATSICKDYLREVDTVRRVYEATHDVGLDNSSMSIAHILKQPYWYAGMYWQVQKTSLNNYILGMQLH